MTVDQLVSRLTGAKKTSSGWMARCPAHDDSTPSLSIAEEGGRLLVHCFAGCKPEAVMAALGLGLSDLFLDGPRLGDSPQRHARPTSQGDGLGWFASYCGVDREFLKTLPLQAQGSAIEFDFGTTRKIRLAGSKEFRWEPVGASTPPLWPPPGEPLPESIWLCEGESDAIVARYAGLDAFAVTKGAKATLGRPEAEALRRRGVKRITVAFDADDAGREGAARLGASLLSAGIDSRVVDLAGAGVVDPLRGQKDLRDAWRACLDPEAFRKALLDAATTPETPVEAGVGATGTPSRFIPADQLLLRGSGAAAEWLPFLGVPGYVGPGLFTLISGRPKSGKTTLLAHVARALVECGLTVAWMGEEPESVWRQRLRELSLGQPGFLIAFADVCSVEEWCEEVRRVSPSVIIVDTARTFLSIGDENDAGQVHRQLMPLIVTARQLNAALIVLHHRRKSDGEDGTDHAGSHAFVGDCDIALTLEEPKGAPTQRLLRARSRFAETARELVLELADDGTYAASGAPAPMSTTTVEQRVRAVLTDEWQTRQQLLTAIGKPAPSAEAVRKALLSLYHRELVERQQGRGNQGRRWRRAPTTSPSGDSPVVGADMDGSSVDGNGAHGHDPADPAAG